MPAFDWANNKEAVRGGDSARKRFEQRARAMNKIWKTDKATADNAMWQSIHMAYAVPLVIAVAKIEGAEQELLEDTLGSKELTEIKIPPTRLVSSQMFLGQSLIGKEVGYSRATRGLQVLVAIAWTSLIDQGHAGSAGQESRAAFRNSRGCQQQQPAGYITSILRES